MHGPLITLNMLRIVPIILMHHAITMAASGPLTGFVLERVLREGQ